MRNVPSGKVHVMIYEMFGLTKEEAAALQAFIDGPSQFLGPRHRSVNHSYQDLLPFLITHSRRDKKKMAQFIAAFTSHILLDKTASKDKKFKAMVEMLPILSAQARK